MKMPSSLDYMKLINAYISIKFTINKIKRQIMTVQDYTYLLKINKPSIYKSLQTYVPTTHQERNGQSTRIGNNNI